MRGSGARACTSCACPGPSSSATSFGLGSRRQAASARAELRAPRARVRTARARGARGSRRPSRGSRPRRRLGCTDRARSRRARTRPAAARPRSRTGAPSARARPRAASAGPVRGAAARTGRRRGYRSARTRTPSVAAARVGSVEREPVGGGPPVVVDAIGIGAGREQAGTRSWWPRCMATWSGVAPANAGAFGSAPASRRYSTTARSPPTVAAHNGDSAPAQSHRSRTGAPASTKQAYEVDVARLRPPGSAPTRGPRT